MTPLATTDVVKLLCQAHGWPLPDTEVRFHPVRKWRFDWAWPDRKIALEQEGGIWQGGRHTRGPGYLKDLEKYNTAAVLGWVVLRATPTQIRRQEVLPMLQQAFALRG